MTSVMDGFTGLDQNSLCSESELEALFAAASDENIAHEVSLKKEAIVVVDDEEVPQPLKGLYEDGPTPFIKKIYGMVGDAETDGIISWSESGMSFVIRDHYKFCVEILPKHFKHANFSSFIRQLNTYVSIFFSFLVILVYNIPTCCPAGCHIVEQWRLRLAVLRSRVRFPGHSESKWATCSEHECASMSTWISRLVEMRGSRLAVPTPV